MRSARTLALAALLAASACVEREDPYSPGWSLGDDADHDGFAAADDCDDHDARVAFLVNAFRDGDGDGVGGEPAQVCAGQGFLPSGFASQRGDCDDANPAIWALGSFWRDADGDGVGAGDREAACSGTTVPAGWTTAGGDCAPDDGRAWQLLAYAGRDADGDHFAVPEAGQVCAGAYLPDGYRAEPPGTVDCDDADPEGFITWSGFADADADGWGTEPVAVCAGAQRPSTLAVRQGDCAPGDPSAWQSLSYLYVDGDLDGAGVFSYGSVCAGAALPPGFLVASSVEDCDDRDALLSTWRWLYADADRDGVGAGVEERVCTGFARPPGWAEQGGDCAPGDFTRWRTWAYTTRDEDGDGRTMLAPGELCLGLDAPPAGYGAALVGPDCDDTDGAVWAQVTGYLDTDGDGVGSGPAIVSCTAGERPAGQVASGTDCAADDPARWRVASHGWVDRDGDGATAVEAGQVCTGAALPEPYRAVKSGNDCDDGTTALFRWVVLYPDGDGDGIGAPPRQIPCLGAVLPAGFSVEGWDEDDGDPGVLLAPSP